MGSVEPIADGVASLVGQARLAPVVILALLAVFLGSLDSVVFLALIVVGVELQESKDFAEILVFLESAERQACVEPQVSAGNRGVAVFLAHFLAFLVLVVLVHILA